MFEALLDRYAGPAIQAYESVKGRSKGNLHDFKHGYKQGMKRAKNECVDEFEPRGAYNVLVDVLNRLNKTDPKKDPEMFGITIGELLGAVKYSPKVLFRRTGMLRFITITDRLKDMKVDVSAIRKRIKRLKHKKMLQEMAEFNAKAKGINIKDSRVHDWIDDWFGYYKKCLEHL